MTRCVGAAWERFCREKREIIIRSFRCIGASLPINGSSDGEISIKGLPTPHLMTALQDWKTRGAPTADEGTASSSDDTAEDSSSSDDESDVEGQPSVSDTTRGKPMVRGVSGHGRAGCAGRGRGRGRGKNLASVRLAPTTSYGHSHVQSCTSSHSTGRPPHRRTSCTPRRSTSSRNAAKC